MKILARNVNKNTMVVYDIDDAVDFKEYICNIEDSKLSDMIFEKMSKKDANSIKLEREFFISFGSSNKYDWMDGHDPVTVGLSIVAPTMFDARNFAFEHIGYGWSTSYTDRTESMHKIFTQKNIIKKG